MRVRLSVLTSPLKTQRVMFYPSAYSAKPREIFAQLTHLRVRAVMRTVGGGPARPVAGTSSSRLPLPPLLLPPVGENLVVLRRMIKQRETQPIPPPLPRVCSILSSSSSSPSSSSSNRPLCHQMAAVLVPSTTPPWSPPSFLIPP
jgi:hypothetical protein